MDKRLNDISKEVTISSKKVEDINQKFDVKIEEINTKLGDIAKISSQKHI